MRQISRGALLIVAVCAGMSALVAVQYQTTFQGSIDASGLRVLAENPAIRVIFGPPLALDDPGGFTVWRTGLPVLLLSGVWALLAAIRITRGEEDAGRLDLLLAGRVRMVDVVARAMSALALAATLIAVTVGTALVVAGTDITGAVIYSVAVLGVTVCIAAAAVFSAQVMPSRSAAIGVTVGLLGIGLALRMLADGVGQLGWLSWLTPFGLTELAAPYAGNRATPLLVLFVMAIGFVVASLAAAAHRDVGGGLVWVSTRRSPRIRLLKSLEGFAIRRALRPTAGWMTGIAMYYLLIGALIASIIEFLRSNRRFGELAASAGFGGLTSANGFAAALFALLPIATGLFAATRLATVVADERARRWTSVLSRPVSRVRLLSVDVVVATTAVVVLHVIAGLAMWTGTVLTGAQFTAGAALAGAVNSVPIALLAIGAAAFAIGWLPSSVVAIGAVPVVGGFLLDVLTHGAGAPDWVVRLSPFAHLGAVPNVPPNWTGIAACTAIASITAAVGIAGFYRRDLDS